MTPVRYSEHPKASAGDPCVTCGAGTPDPVVDHCHTHLWVRGVLCRRCNVAMGFIDQGKAPSSPPVALSELATHVGRCHECAPADPSSLAPLSNPDAGTYTTVQFRNIAGELLDRARFAGQHSAITRRGDVLAYVVPVDWYERALLALEREAT